MQTYLAAYDICNPKRLNKIRKVFKEFGFRSQYSVFICKIQDTDFLVLKNRIEDIMDKKEDKVFIIELCDRCIDHTEIIGMQEGLKLPDVFIF